MTAPQAPTSATRRAPDSATSAPADAPLWAGFGFSTAAGAESLREAYAQIGPAHGLATAADKAQSEAFRSFAKSLSLPVHQVPAQTLEQQTTLTQSEASQTARNTGSVAEAAALAAAGPGAQLLGPRVVSKDGLATCAIAKGAAK